MNEVNLSEYYIGYCPLSKVYAYVLHTGFRKLFLLSSLSCPYADIILSGFAKERQTILSLER
jgi:hypothetical protein